MDANEQIKRLVEFFETNYHSKIVERARKEGNSLFRPLTLPKPYTSPKDVF